MAGQIYQQYLAYKERTERLSFTYFLDSSLLQDFIKESNLLSSHCKTEMSGTYVGTYQHPDGRVAEVWTDGNGFYSKAKVWVTKDAWFNHHEAMPFNIWAWG